mmetsp:Transcript_27691/g.70592  ORF Transcript_27691/g.70592 Transcript_27691/m.70592 type:complete len:255 (+) Transcript_27691:77-841(+)
MVLSESGAGLFRCVCGLVSDRPCVWSAPGLVASMVTYAMQALHAAATSSAARILRRCSGTHATARGTIHLLGLFYATLGLVSYSERELGPLFGISFLTYQAMLVAGFAVQALCHVVIACYLALETPRRDDACTLLKVYALTVIAAAVAIPVQRVEAGGCPGWLFETHLNLHAVWHVAIYVVAYNCISLYLLVEAPRDVGCGGTCSAFAPWLFIKVVPQQGALRLGLRSYSGSQMGRGTIELAPTSLGTSSTVNP